MISPTGMFPKLLKDFASPSSPVSYKSLLKEQGLNNLVRLLIAQKADVLLMGGDYQEGCEYVEPLFAALSRVKTPWGHTA